MVMDDVIFVDKIREDHFIYVRGAYNIFKEFVGSQGIKVQVNI